MPVERLNPIGKGLRSIQKLISVAYLSTVGNKFQINKNIHIPSYQLELLCQVNMPNKTTIEANYIKQTLMYIVSAYNKYEHFNFYELAA